MTLLETIENLIHFEYEVTFKSESRHLILILKNGENKKESWLPLSDHSYEEKIITHLNLMAADISK